MAKILFLSSCCYFEVAYKQEREWARESVSVSFPCTVDRTIFKRLSPGEVIQSKPAFKCILTIFDCVLSWHNLYAVDASIEVKKKAVPPMSFYLTRQRFEILRKLANNAL